MLWRNGTKPTRVFMVKDGIYGTEPQHHHQSQRVPVGCAERRIRQIFHRAELSGTAGFRQGNQRFQRHVRGGLRNNWHIHHKACQILIAVGGRGYYQEWGKEPVELNPGDVVYVAPETKHWHGAAPDSDFAHIAIMNVADGASNEWLEPVEAEYDALRCIDEAAKSM